MQRNWRESDEKKFKIFRFLPGAYLFSYVSAGCSCSNFSFNESKLPVAFTGFSLKWYEELFRDSAMMEALGNSLILGVLSCLCAAVIGTLGAVGLFRINWKTKGALEYVSILPLMIPEIILGMVLMAFLHAWPSFRYAHSFDRTYGILCSLYINAGKSAACGNGSVS